MKKTMLLEEPPLLVQKSLARVIGLNRAIFIQQLHFMVSRYGKYRSDGAKWLRWSLPNFREKVFPFWSPRTIQRILQDLEEKGWVRSQQEPGSTARYTIDYELFFNHLELERLDSVGGSQNDVTQRQTDVTRRQTDVTAPYIESIREKEEERETGPKGPGISKPRKTAKQIQEEGRRENIRQGHEKKFREAYDKKQSVQAAEKLWEMLSKEFHNDCIGFTPADRRNMKGTMRSFCEKSGIHPIVFIEWAIQNWDKLRVHKHLKWAKLGEIPTFGDLFKLKDKFLLVFKEKRKKGGATKKGEVFTRIKDVPKDHPRYDEIVLSIRTTGKAVLQ